MVGVAISIAIAFVYNGPRQEMARDFDALGLGTIAPAGSEGILVDRLADLALRPLASIDGRLRQWDEATLEDPDALLALGYAELARSSQPERVLIATGFDDAAVARLRARAAKDHIRLLAGPPSLARDVLVPAPPIRERCPELRAGWHARHFHHHDRHALRWARLPAALGLLLVAAGLARVAARPRLM